MTLLKASRLNVRQTECSSRLSSRLMQADSWLDSHFRSPRCKIRFQETVIITSTLLVAPGLNKIRMDDHPIFILDLQLQLNHKLISLYSIHFFNWCYFFNIVYSDLNCASEEIFQTITSILFVRSNRQLIKIDSLSNVINLYLKIALNLRESRTMVLMLLHNRICTRKCRPFIHSVKTLRW